MTTFNLAEVRDAFVADMTRFLSQIEESARRLVAIAPSDQTEKLGREPMDLVGASLHTIDGTSSLLGLQSILGASRGMERLRTTADESIRQIAHHAALLRQIGDVWIDGAVAMRGMVTFELDGKSAEAMTRQKVLLNRIDRIANPVAAPGAAGADAGWDDPQTDTGASELSSAPSSSMGGSVAGVEDELLEVFREEAREAINGLRGLAIKLTSNPADTHSATQVARLLHLLKGAAASVELTAVSDLAKELHAPIEERNEAARPLDASLVKVLHAGVEKLAALALPAANERGAAPSFQEPPSQMDDGDDAAALFRDEALRILTEADPILRDVISGAPAGRAEALGRLERLFHRLKGSSLVVGRDRVGAIAARIQSLCEPGPSVFDSSEVAKAVSEIRRELKAGPTEMMPVARPTVTPSKVTPVDGELWEAFVGEAGEILDEMDRILNTLDRVTDPRGAMRTLLRHYHTLKGAANTAGLAPVGAEIHIVETFLERETDARVLPPLGLVSSALGDVHRRMRKNLMRAQDQGIVDAGAAQVEYVLTNLGKSSQAPSTVQPSTGLWLGSGDPAWSAPDSRSNAPSSRRPASSRDESEAGSDVVEGIERRYIRVPVERLDGLMNMVGELVVSRSRMMSRLDVLRSMYADDEGRRRDIVSIVDAFASQNTFTNLDGTQSKAKRQRHDAGVPRAKGTNGHPAQNGHPAGDGDTEIGAGDTDLQARPQYADFGALELDSYEEIHILSRRLTEAANDVSESSQAINVALTSLTDDGDSISSIVSGLQGDITRARMVPLETLFQRLYLPVRDAAQRQAKSVDVATRGESVSIDKSMADALYAPMLHLVRNAVAHGVESEEQRRRSGKPERGSITLTARQESGQIFIEIADDGGGVDVERLRKVGVERGMLAPSVSADDPAVLELMFVSGVSTSRTVGDVAGRGVGCDVVRRAIERLNGDIRVATTRGVGTVFTISLPLTMSITQAVMVRDGDRVLAIPMHFAERIVEPDPTQILASLDRRRINVEGELLPMRSASELFGEAPRENIGAILVCVVGDNAFALEVEAVVGQEEIVVKSLGDVLHGHPLFAGVTLRGDGELSLILDVPGIMATVVERAASMPAVHTVQLAAPVAVVDRELHPLGVPIVATTGSASLSSASPSSAAPSSASPSSASPSSASPSSASPSSAAPSSASPSSAAPSSASEPGKSPAPAAAKAAAPAPTAKPLPASAKAVPPPVPARKAMPPIPGQKAQPVPAPGAKKAVSTRVLATGTEPGVPAVAALALGPIKVLFVDDSLSVRKVAERVLQSLGGVDVTVAVDGQDALDQLRVASFDLVFTDLEMPRLHGFELIREMRFVPAYQAIPVVVVSSRSGAKHVEHALSMGANEYLTKPFTAENLASSIKRWVKRGGG